jgi:hypothetical protein
MNGGTWRYGTSYDWWVLYSTPCVDRPTAADNESTAWPISIYQ